MGQRIYLGRAASHDFHARCSKQSRHPLYPSLAIDRNADQAQTAAFDVYRESAGCSTERVVDEPPATKARSTITRQRR